MNSRRTKRGGAKLTKGKISKNSTKSKIAKILLLRIAPKAKLFLTPKARQAFTQLKQAFTEGLILHHFNSKRYIYIRTDTSGYVLGGALSQLTLDQYISTSNKNSSKSTNAG